MNKYHSVRPCVHVCECGCVKVCVCLCFFIFIFCSESFLSLPPYLLYRNFVISRDAGSTVQCAGIMKGHTAHRQFPYNTPVYTHSAMLPLLLAKNCPASLSSRPPPPPPPSSRAAKNIGRIDPNLGKLGAFLASQEYDCARGKIGRCLSPPSPL